MAASTGGADRRAIGADAATSKAQAGSIGADEYARLLRAERSARRAAEEAADRMARLQRVTAALANTLDRGRMASLVVDQCLDALGAAAGSVATLEPGGAELRILAARGYSSERVVRYQNFRLDAALPMAEAARTGDAVFVSALDGIPPPRFPHMLRDDPGRVGWAAVPLRVDDRTIGAVGLSFAGTDLPVAEDGAFLLALAQQCAQALERARLHDAEQLALERAHAAERDKDESLALLDTILESAPVGLAFWDRQQRFVRVNRALAEIDGATPDAHVGRTVAEVLPGFPSIVAGTVAQVAESGRPVVEQEVSGETPAHPGEQRHWLASYYPVRAEGGRVMGVGAVILEITERKRAEVERERARVARDAFIGVLSHELRTPVTTIFGNTKLLNRTDRVLDPVSRQEAYADIQAESERLYRLVEDLLVLARYGEDARHVIDTEPLLLQRIVPAVIRSERARWPSTAFEPLIPANLPAVQGDQTYVEQVLRNLLSNAAKYGGRDAARVRIVVDATDDEATVRVLDDGPGFSDEEGEHLFELFYRAPGALTTASGAGIGLFVCRSLVEAMGGRIWARPRPSGGAEFGFVLRSFVEEGV